MMMIEIVVIFDVKNTKVFFKKLWYEQQRYTITLLPVVLHVSSSSRCRAWWRIPAPPPASHSDSTNTNSQSHWKIHLKSSSLKKTSTLVLYKLKSRHRTTHIRYRRSTTYTHHCLFSKSFIPSGWRGGAHALPPHKVLFDSDPRQLSLTN